MKKKIFFISLCLEIIGVVFINNYIFKIIYTAFLLILLVICHHLISMKELKDSIKDEEKIYNATYVLFTTNYVVSLNIFNKWKLLYSDIENFEIKWVFEFGLFNRTIYFYTKDKKKYKSLLYRASLPGLSLEEYSEKIILKILNKKCKNIINK